ncbi:MAG: hypothetical protein M3P29_02495 [Acidobacteriota bacterium]|nr:hypothetical protein [Acidobacteriota bacterium]
MPLQKPGAIHSPAADHAATFGTVVAGGAIVIAAAAAFALLKYPVAAGGGVQFAPLFLIVFDAARPAAGTAAFRND